MGKGKLKKIHLDYDNPNRKWKYIKNFKNVVNYMYKVSNDGLILRVTDDKILHKKICNKMKHPYESVNLDTITGASEWFLVHRIVATAFCKVPKKYKDIDNLVVDHLDNDGLNNNASNLEWVTIGENSKRSVLRNDIQRHPKCNIELSEGIVEEICSMLEQKYTYKQIAEELGIEYTYNNIKPIADIKTFKTYTDISSKYNIDPSKPNIAPLAPTLTSAALPNASDSILPHIPLKQKIKIYFNLP